MYNFLKLMPLMFIVVLSALFMNVAFMYYRVVCLISLCCMTEHKTENSDNP